MNKVGAIIVGISLLAAAILNITSCEKYVLPEIKLSADTLALSDQAQSVNVAVRANIVWEPTVSYEAETWLSISPDGKLKGDTTLVVTVTANENQEPREGLVIVTSETLKKTIVVLQDGLR